ncbi:hypothetical protein EDB19DRAFT_1736269 [Suillus lakei]|nr:hypothetical protein EDB19DRAFT_1736269 [Suillus lakei]
MRDEHIVKSSSSARVWTHQWFESILWSVRTSFQFAAARKPMAIWPRTLEGQCRGDFSRCEQAALLTAPSCRVWVFQNLAMMPLQEVTKLTCFLRCQSRLSAGLVQDPTPHLANIFILVNFCSSTVQSLRHSVGENLTPLVVMIIDHVPGQHNSVLLLCTFLYVWSACANSSNARITATPSPATT